MAFQQWNFMTTEFAKIAQEMCQHGQGSPKYEVAMNEAILNKIQQSIGMTGDAPGDVGMGPPHHPGTSLRSNPV
jgi:hypothetical protein